ncbi:hypothetical protein Droror1_Dr00020949 [Drosera rotundifolia]
MATSTGCSPSAAVSLQRRVMCNSRRRRFNPLLICSSVTSVRTPCQNTLIFEAVRLLGPPAKFEASKLKVAFKGEEIDAYTRVVPRIYTLSHCDFTANLTLTVSNIINTDQLLGWYKKDDVLAVWKEVKGSLCLHVHCYVGGPNLFHDLAAEFRYHIFSKELPLVLRAVLHGDSALFREHPDLDEAVVWVHFHSSSAKYNRVECWGSLRDASQSQRQQGEEMHAMMSTDDKGSEDREKWGMRKSFFQALFAFILL